MISITYTSVKQRFIYSQLLPIIALLYITLFSTGCSIREYLVKKVVGSGEGLTEVFLNEDDPQLVREAMPSNIKMIEIILSQSPYNPDLLLTASKSYTMYAYAFIQQDADRLALENISEANIIKQRLRKLYSRGRNYSLRALDVKYPGFENAFRQNPQAALKRVKVEDVSYLYWTAAALGGLIKSSKADPEVIIDLPQIGYLLERALELDEDYDKGALHEMMISYSIARPDATSDAERIAREHFNRVIELTNGESASAYVSLAEAVSVKNQNREEYLNLLNRALEIDVDKNPSTRLANIIAQERARWLKEIVEELFI